MAHEYVIGDTDELIAANVGGWGVVGADAADESQLRRASYRAMQIEYVDQLNDMSAMRSPPDAAVYYPARIYYGHSYEVVFYCCRSLRRA
jgi:hypothetical protein